MTSGLDAAWEILAEDPAAVIVLFSAFLSDATLAEEVIGVKARVSKATSAASPTSSSPSHGPRSRRVTAEPALDRCRLRIPYSAK